MILGWAEAKPQPQITYLDYSQLAHVFQIWTLRAFFMVKYKDSR